MKLECSGCSARYTIEDGIIPPQGAKIRCRKCGAVIDVPARSATPRVEPAPTATPAVPASAPLPPVSYTAPASQPITPAPPPSPAPVGAAGFSFLSSNGGDGAASAPATVAPAV